MLVFLKKLLGQDEEALKTQARFNDSLTRAADHKKKLNDAGVAIEAIIRDVDRKKDEIALSRAASGISGEHMLSSIPPVNPEKNHG